MGKICSKCGLEKEYHKFNKKCDTKDGYALICKDCKKLNRNKEKDSETYKKWAAEHREHLNKRAREYRASLPKKERTKQTKEEKRLHQNIYYKNRIKNDPAFKIRRNIKRNIIFSLKRNNLIKNTKTQIILGCSFEEFKKHLESKWEPWMSWNNYGLYNGTPNYGWDIDHIVPSSFGLTIDEIYKLNHYTNLQPLCSYVNRAIKQDNL